MPTHKSIQGKLVGRCGLKRIPVDTAMLRLVSLLVLKEGSKGRAIYTGIVDVS